MKENEFMTIEELCAYLNIGRSTAYKLIKSKTIPATKISSKWLINRNQIQKIMQSKTTWQHHKTLTYTLTYQVDKYRKKQEILEDEKYTWKCDFEKTLKIQEKKSFPFQESSQVAGLQGFEPWNDGVRVRCLTVWR